MSERDPRVEPIRDDVVLIGKHNIEATVLGITTDQCVRYTVPCNGSCVVCKCPSIAEWIKCLSGKTVVRKGDA